MTKETYQKSVDILLDAYNSRTLFHGNCAACAIGNLVSANMGYEFDGTNDYLEARPEWFYCVMWSKPSLDLFHGEGRKQIESTGLTLEEVFIIERAFESEEDEEGQFLGLCAVLNVMKDMVNEEVSHKENQERLELIHQTIIQ